MKFKKVKNQEKQKKLWNSLIIGDKDFEDCGESWDIWNTKIIPTRRKMNKILEARKIYNLSKS